MVDPMSEEHIYVTRGFSLNIPSSSHEGEFRWSCLPTFEAGGPERSPRVKDPLLLPGRSLKKMNIYLLLFFFPWSWLIVWRVFTNQFHVKKLRDKNKINLCMHLSSGGADTTLAHVYPAMIALLFAVGGIFQKKLFLDKKFWIQTNNSFLYTIF